MAQALRIQPDGHRVPKTDLHLYLCAHELYTGCRLGVKRSRVYNVTNWVETYCCKNFIACPFELKLMAFYDDLDSVYFKIAKPHLHDVTKETSKPFYSVQLFLKQNIVLPRDELIVALGYFFDRALEKGDLIGKMHRFEFKNLPLGRTTAFVFEDLVPKVYALHAKKAYYRRQLRELQNEEQQLNEGSQMSALH